MPSWNIHTAHDERLLREEGAESLGVRDANAFLLGNLAPDIYVGYMVPDTTYRIDYKLTHQALREHIPLPGYDEFWNFYVARQERVSDLTLGADVDPVAYLEAARKEKADVVGLSALMTTTMPGQEEFIKLVADAGDKGKYLVCVGGAPTSVEWAERIGADVWSFDAFECAAKLKKLLA